MILCIDSGNTRLKWGLREGEAWRAQGSTAHLLAGSEADRIAQQHGRPTRLVACNVAGATGREAIALAAAHLGPDLAIEWVHAQASQCGVTSRYDEPAQLGADRWAALIGAHGRVGGACLVVNCGTATTIDVLNVDGVFQGGLILPGLSLMRTTLANATADLPTARGDYRPLPRNTFDAINSGAIEATLGAIERMSRRIASAEFVCVISGGAAQELAPHLEVPHRMIDNLVLEGIARIAHEIAAAL